MIGEYFKANLPYYSNVFRSEIPEGFKYYFRNLYLNEMRKDLLYLLDDFELPENNTEFIAGYFTDSCFGWLVRMPSENKGNLDLSHGFDYNNITHELMKLFVEKLKNR